MLHSRPVRAAIIVCLLATLGPAAGGGCRRLAQPKPGGALAIGYIGPPVRLDPLLAEGLDWPSQLVFDNLVALDPAGEYVPALAASWSLQDDGRRLTFVLRDGVKFHDGTPCDAAAVKFSLERTVAGGSGLAARFGTLKEVVAVDRLTVTLTFERPYPPIWEALASPAGAIVSPTQARQLGDDFWKAPTGTGPYRVVSTSPAGRVELAVNAEYAWPPAFYRNRGRAYLDQVSFEPFPGVDELSEALANGRIDAVASGAAAGDSRNHRVFEYFEPTLFYLAFNVRRAPWDNVDLRRALAQAIDPVAVAAAGGNPRLAPSRSSLPPGVYGHAKEAVAALPPPGSAKAEAALEAAGFVRGGGTGVRQRDNVPLALTLLVPALPEGERAAAEVARQLSQVGVQVDVRVRPLDQVLSATADGVYDAALLNYAWDGPDVLFYFFHSSRVGRMNRTGYVDARLDLLLEVSTVAAAPADRRAVAAEVQRLLALDVPWLPLFTLVERAAFHQAVKGVGVGTGGRLYLHDAHRF